MICPIFGINNIIRISFQMILAYKPDFKLAYTDLKLHFFLEL